MAEVKWIKIVTDIFDDEKMLLIESLPSADSIIVIWFKLLCLAGKNNNSGVFMLNERIAYTDEMLATIFRRDINTVRLALNTFKDFEMIEIMNNVITIPNWSKHQTLDQLEERKEYMKEYMKTYRNRQKLIANGECKVNSKSNSKANVNPLEEDKEIDKDKNKNKKKKETDFDLLIKEYTENEELQTNIYEFVKMRKGIKAAITTLGLKKMLNELNRIASNDLEKIKILDNSIMNSWKGVFALKGGDYGVTGKNFKASKKFNIPKEEWDPSKQTTIEGEEPF